jgi:signal transduction histidine kinase
MNTEFSDVLSVVAHELRSPLSVLQGYIRLLQGKRDPGDPERGMLAAMLGATTRLSALGRDASDLAAWVRRDPTATVVPTSALVQAVASHAANGLNVVPCDEVVGQLPLRMADVEALAAALNALADLALRETRQSTGAMTFRSGDTPATLYVRIVVGPDALLFEQEPSAPEPTSPVPFNRGGLGLSLCLASYVLETHDATATATPDLARIDVRLHVLSAAA